MSRRSPDGACLMVLTQQFRNPWAITAMVMAGMALTWHFVLGAAQDGAREDLKPKGPQDQIGIISWGERVRFEDWLVGDYKTVFAVVSRFQPESMEVMSWLEPACKRKGILLRKIALKHFDCEVARQLEVDHPLPRLWLYDGKKLLSEDRDDVLELVSGMENRQ